MTAVRPADVSGSFRLPFRTILSYSVGHVLNDLCACLWFTYLLLFLRQVVQLSSASAGYLLLWGQVVDAIFTPLIGYACDRMRGMCRYGRRKSWHALGTICVLISFPFMFSRSVGMTTEISRSLYYAFFIFIFQFGWAATQVAHLALMPELTTVDGERVELNAIRNSFTVLCNVVVYSIAWLLFSFNQDSASEFFTLMCISVTIGAVFSLVFHVGTNEQLPTTDSHAQLLADDIQCLDWLKEPQFYLARH